MKLLAKLDLILSEGRVGFYHLPIDQIINKLKEKGDFGVGYIPKLRVQMSSAKKAGDTEKYEKIKKIVSMIQGDNVPKRGRKPTDKETTGFGVEYGPDDSHLINTKFFDTKKEAETFIDSLKGKSWKLTKNTYAGGFSTDGKREEITNSKDNKNNDESKTSVNFKTMSSDEILKYFMDTYNGKQWNFIFNKIRAEGNKAGNTKTRNKIELAGYKFLVKNDREKYVDIDYDKIKNADKDDDVPDRIKETFTKDEDGNRKKLGDIHSNLAKDKDENHYRYIAGYNDGIMATSYSKEFDERMAAAEATSVGIYNMKERKIYIKAWMKGAEHALKQKADGKKPIFLEKNYSLV